MHSPTLLELNELDTTRPPQTLLHAALQALPIPTWNVDLFVPHEAVIVVGSKNCTCEYKGVGLET